MMELRRLVSPFHKEISMAWTGSDGSEHETSYDKELHEKINLGKGDSGGSGWGDTLRDSGNNMSVGGALIPVFIFGIVGLLVPFRGLLQDLYLIYVPLSRFFLVSIIAAIILGVLLFKFVITPARIAAARGDIPVLRGILLLIIVLVTLAGFVNGGFHILGGLHFVNQQIDIRWRNSFYTFDVAKVSADMAVLRTAPAADAKAALTLEQGEELSIYGDIGNGWYFACDRDRSDDIQNYGYVQADTVTLDDPDAELQAMRPATLIVDHASMHRARRWQSWQTSYAEKDEYVLATGKSRGGWTPVYNVGSEGWEVGYMNDALLFFNDGADGVQVPAEPKGIEERILDFDGVRFTYWGSGRPDVDRNTADQIQILPKGARLIFLAEQTERQYAPVVYNGRMGWVNWWGYEAYKRDAAADVAEDAVIAAGTSILYPVGTVLTVKSSGAQFYESDGKGGYQANEDTRRPALGETFTMTEKTISGAETGRFPTTYKGKEGYLVGNGFRLSGPPLGKAVLNKNEKLYDGTVIQIFGGSKVLASLKKGDTVTYYGFYKTEVDGPTYIFVETEDGTGGYTNLDSLDR
jgi:hypothetical protein